MGGVDFEAIYGAYFSDVYFYMLHLCRDQHMAEELTSETFFRALRAIGKFRGDCDIRVWLCRIARNCYAAHQKRAARVSTAGDDALEALPAKGPPVAEQVAARDTAARLQAREGGNFEMFRTRWVPLEEGYLQAYGIEAAADLVLRTDASGG